MTKARGDAFIQVAQQSRPPQGATQGLMKKAVILLLLSATGLAQAEEEKEVPRPKRNMEEVVVTGYSWNPNEHKGALIMGLSGAYLIHEYDKVRDEWRFVRASNQPKKDN